MTPSPPRFFLAHAKSCSDEELDRLSGVACRILERVSKGRPFSLVIARDYFDARFRAAGSWEAWACEIVSGVSFTTREPIFNGILVPMGPVGAGTAKIIARALEARRPVFTFDGEGRWTAIKRLETRDPQDWQSGFSLVI